MPATELPRLRSRLALMYAMAAVILGAVPVAIAGLGAWTGGSTQVPGTADTGGAASNTGPVLAAVAAGLILVALAAVPIGWALAGRALRPLREITFAAEGATPERLPGHGELGRYEEFADLSTTLAGLYARLDAAYAAQRRFVADASHELRTPLTAQRALLQVTLADPDADATTLRAMSSELLRIGAQQERLVAALLALAQGQQGLVATEPVDLATLAAEAVRSRRDLGLTIRSDLRPAVVAHADRTRLTSLIGNLVDNAIRHNLDGGRIDVETRVRGTRSELEINNTGPVVPADEVERIMQPFQRLTVPRMQRESSGLGLAIVAAIAESHGADLLVVPNPGGGLTVTVRFPALAQ